MERGWGYPIPNGYGDETINSNPSGIGYGYGDMLRSRGKGLGRQYPYPTHPIAMSSFNQRRKPVPSGSLLEGRETKFNAGYKDELCLF